MTLVLNLPPALEQRLGQESQRQGVATADYALQMFQQDLVPTDEEFKQVADHVLRKNAELYGRLA